jgi:transcriptional regulator with XRE-family HTH domain
MSLADNLRRLRHERFLSQAELADKAGVHRATIARVELGDYVPYPRTLRRLAEALDVPPRALIPPEELAGKSTAGEAPAVPSSGR